MRRDRNIFVITFSATVFFGAIALGLILFTFTPALAEDVDVTADVNNIVCGNGVKETGETCDGSAGASNCYNNACNDDCTCPVCGNGSVDSGEECETDSDCSNGQECSSSCECATPPIIPCTPTSCTVTSWSGSCINGTESGTGINNCGNPCAGFRSCGVACGDGQINQAGEQCDDGNTQSGDCCSSSCSVELLINASAAPQSNSATIQWSTQCQATSSILTWTTVTQGGGGSSSGLTGQNYSYVINNLQSGTTYLYTITASNGTLQNTYNGTFKTSGGVEICSNGIDDDNNGKCDFPASACSDGSVPGDSACQCTANFVCTKGECQNNQQTYTCVDQASPKCQPDYQYQEGCGECEGVVCSPSRQLNTSTCECEVIPNACGNGICEPPAETPYNCIQDCPVNCLSDWQCTPWQPEECPSNGIQARNCFDRNGCTQPINQPPTVQSCSALCPGLSCGTGQQINLEQCTCENIIPFCGNGVCESGESYNSCQQDCLPACTPSWTCTAWSDCQSGIQSRTCSDFNSCNLQRGHPPEIKACSDGCSIACSPSQRLNAAQCSCENIVPFCGNNICEENEATWSCPTDCGVPPEFLVSISTCLDGFDNDGDGIIDYPLDPGCSGPGDGSELNVQEVLSTAQEFISEKIINNEGVEVVTERIAAPAVASTVAVSTFSSFSALNFLTYLKFLFTEPFQILFRRKRKRWGIVYNSLSKQPIDLAIVRLYRQSDGSIVQSRVTDRQGRYSFLVEPGQYYMTVTKPQYAFPTQLFKDQDHDTKYLELYHGKIIATNENSPEITFNIPLDPQGETQAPKKILWGYYLRKGQNLVAFSAIPISLVALVITPRPLTIILVGYHIVLYILFRRLAYQKPPKSWGKIFNKQTKEPISRAIARIYDQQYNKLLETRVTDSKGRYSFLVDKNKYYVTVQKNGFSEFKSDTIDLVEKDKDTIVDYDIGLQPAEREVPLSIPERQLPKSEMVSSVMPVSAPNALSALDMALAQHGSSSDISLHDSTVISRMPEKKVQKSAEKSKEEWALKQNINNKSYRIKKKDAEELVSSQQSFKNIFS